MRTICATMTQHSVSTGMREGAKNCAERLDVADVGQRRQPVQMHGEDEHRRASRPGTPGTDDRRQREHARRSGRYSEPRQMAAVMPSSSATGTETAAVTAASSSEFGSRLPIELATGSWLTSETAGVAASAGRPASASSAARRADRGPARRAGRAPPPASPLWPSSCCATSPGSSSVMREDQRATPAAGEQQPRRAERLAEQKPSRPAPRRIRPRARRSRRSCSPSGRRAGSARRPFSFARMAVEEADEHRDADAGLRRGSSPACRHTSACAWPRRSPRARRPAAGRISRSSSALSFHGGIGLEEQRQQDVGARARVDVAEADRMLHPVIATSNHRPARGFTSRLRPIFCAGLLHQQRHVHGVLGRRRANDRHVALPTPAFWKWNLALSRSKGRCGSPAK